MPDNSAINILKQQRMILLVKNYRTSYFLRLVIIIIMKESNIKMKNIYDIIIVQYIQKFEESIIFFNEFHKQDSRIRLFDKIRELKIPLQTRILEERTIQTITHYIQNFPLMKDVNPLKKRISMYAK